MEIAEDHDCFRVRSEKVFRQGVPTPVEDLLLLVEDLLHCTSTHEGRKGADDHPAASVGYKGKEVLLCTENDHREVRDTRGFPDDDGDGRTAPETRTLNKRKDGAATLHDRVRWLPW